MDGPETFEFAAAVAGVSIGLAAALLLCLLAVVGGWRLFRDASAASEATGRAALSMEELARALSARPAPSGGEPWEARQQLEQLIDQQRRLQEMTRGLVDTVTADGTPAAVALDEIERAIGRLDANMGQMASSLANLIRLLEGQQGRR